MKTRGERAETAAQQSGHGQLAALIRSATASLTPGNVTRPKGGAEGTRPRGLEEQPALCRMFRKGARCVSNERTLCRSVQAQSSLVFILYRSGLAAALHVGEMHTRKVSTGWDLYATALCIRAFRAVPRTPPTPQTGVRFPALLRSWARPSGSVPFTRLAQSPSKDLDDHRSRLRLQQSLPR